MAPARGATTMMRLGKPMHPYHGSGRACPCHAGLHSILHSPAKSCVPPQVVRSPEELLQKYIYEVKELNAFVTAELRA